MSSPSHYRKFLVLLISLVIVLTGCNNPTPTPNTPYSVGCGDLALIDAINYANSHAGHDILNLGNCVYTLTKTDNSANVDGITVYNGLPVISSEITIHGNNTVIEIQKDPGEPFFGHFFIGPDGDLALYDLQLSAGTRPVGGAVINNGGDFFASDVNFMNNTAYPLDSGVPARGGAIFGVDGRVRVIDGSHFQDNNAGETMTGGANQGGAIYVMNSGLIVSNSSFLWNFAAGDGGAIYAEKTPANDNGGAIALTGDEFNENSATRNGGGVAVVNEIEGVYITTTWFRQHEADQFGGAIYAEGSQVSNTQVEYRLNSASYGGAVYTKRVGEGVSSQFSDKSSEYISNTASEIGGAIFSENSNLLLDDSTFESNQAKSCGAVRHGGDPDLDVQAGDLETAPHIPSTFRIFDSAFRFNEALESHGGAICHVMGDFLLKTTRVTQNQAVDSGGGVIIHDEAEINNSIISGNSARNGGGLLIGYPLQNYPDPDLNVWVHPDYMTFQTTIIGTAIAANQASYTGGGIFVHNLGSTLIARSFFQNNIADWAGGGIRIEEGDMFIRNTTFSSNTAYVGGGLYARGDITSNPVLGLKHVTFAYNVATETSNGGNVYNNRWGGGALNVGGTVNVENSLFVDNQSMDCQLKNGMNYNSSGTFDTDGTCAGQIETNPLIGPLTNNGGGTKTHALLAGSPLIDVLADCAGLTEDQRGIQRPQGSACDPGSYEYDASNPPPPPPEPGSDSGQSPTSTPESDDICSLFGDREISVVELAIPSETMVFPLYFKLNNGIPWYPEGQQSLAYRATLGNLEAYRCGLQGFEDRLYCLFRVTPDMPGQVLTLNLDLNDCPEPVYTQPNMLIPQVTGDNPPVCREDLDPDRCVAAGGTMSTSVTTAPRCICP